MNLVKAEDLERFTNGAIPKQRWWALARENLLPEGLVVRVGRVVMFNQDKVEQWLQSGGSALPGGWRREPAG
jgi:hypothetical protein